MSLRSVTIQTLSAVFLLTGLLNAETALAETAKKKPAAAASEPDPEARRLYKEGDKLYAEGDYEGAVRAFEKAYELSKQPALQYNLANAYERLGRYDDGVKALQEYEPHAAGDERDVVRRRIKKLQERADQQRLEKKAAPPAAADSAPAATTADQAEPELAEPAAEPAGTSTKPPILGYVLIGVGAVGVGVGSYFGVQALSTKSDAEGLCPDVGGSRRCPASANDTLSSNKRDAIIADVGIGIGVVAAAVGTYLVITGGKSSETASARLSPLAGPHGGGVRLTGTF